MVKRDRPHLTDSSSATEAALASVGAMHGVRLERLPRNSGIAAATNAGIAIARGRWVSFIDHDDTFVTGAIAAIAQAIYSLIFNP